MAEPIGFVVRDVTGETQLSIRFISRRDARDFAEKCAMPARVWRVVWKTKGNATKPVVKVCPSCGVPWQPQNPTTCGPCGAFVEHGPVPAEEYAAKRP